MTKKDFLKNAPSIAKAVINQFGGWEQFKESAPDVSNYGIDGGFSGFIYYSETHKFTLKNRAAIVELLEETADSLGVDVVAMVSNFGIFRSSAMDNDDKKDLYKILGVANLLRVQLLMSWRGLQQKRSAGFMQTSNIVSMPVLIDGFFVPYRKLKTLI